jgi:hypothetical protein
MHAALVLLVLIAVASLVGLGAYRARLQRLERERFIRDYVFQASLFESFRQKYPGLAEKDVFLVARALREYFLVYLRAGNQVIGMPSRVVDDLWHEFILATQSYARFCQGAFGRFLHHIPSTDKARSPAIRNGMAVTWRLACLEENIRPQFASRLPLLFAIDEKLHIANGYTYSLNEIVARYKSQADSGASTGCSGTAGGDGDGCDQGCGGDGGSGGCGGGCGGD